MININQLPEHDIKFVFTDIDDTLTIHGRLPWSSYKSLWELREKGFKVIPVTGRPAGWCELIARMWPVDGVIGENGALYYRYDTDQKKMLRKYAVTSKTMESNRQKLNEVQKQVLQEVPGSALASDQFTRLFDLAIDFCEDVPPLTKDEIKKIVDIFKSHGAVAKVSSIHVNGWFGTYDKASMCEQYLKDCYKIKVAEAQDIVAFCGDSPNDEPLFKSFKNSFGVANILNFKDSLETPPKFVSNSEGGDGFVEIATELITKKVN